MNNNSLDNRLIRILKISLCFSFIIIIIPFIIYILYYNGGFSDLQGDWSNFGSYYGGITAPLLSFISIIFIFITFMSQNYKNKIEENNKSQREVEATVLRYLDIVDKVYIELEQFIGDNIKNSNKISRISTMVSEYEVVSNVIKEINIEKANSQKKKKIANEVYALLMKYIPYKRQFSNYFFLCFNVFIQISILPSSSIIRGALECIAYSRFDLEKRKMLAICSLQLLCSGQKLDVSIADSIGLNIKYFENIYDVFKNIPLWTGVRVIQDS